MAEKLNSTDILTLNKGWVLLQYSSNKNSEYFLFNGEDSTRLELNATAWGMLNILDGKNNCQYIAKVLSNIYTIEESILLNDLMMRFRDLLEKKVVTKNSYEQQSLLQNPGLADIRFNVQARAVSHLPGYKWQLIHKQNGAWHKIVVWNNWLIAYKSGGFIFLPLDYLDDAHQRYVPWYDFTDFFSADNVLFVQTKEGRFFELDLNNLDRGISLLFSPSAKKFSVSDISYILKEGERKFLSCPSWDVVALQKELVFYQSNTRIEIAHCILTGYAFLDDIAYANNNLFLADVFGLWTLDVTDLSNLKPDNSFCQMGWAKDFAIVNKDIVCVADVVGFKMYSIYQNYALIGKFESVCNRVAKIVVQNKYAYLSCEASGLKIVDITNPNNLYLVGGALFAPGDGVWDCAVKDDIVYLACYRQGLRKIRLTSVNQVQEEASYKDTEGAFEVIGVHLSENSFLFAACGENGLAILEKDSLQCLSKIPLQQGKCWAIQTDGDIAYASCGSGGLLVINITVPADPFIIQNIPLQEARSVAIEGNLLCVAAGRDGVYCYHKGKDGSLIEKEHIPSSAFTREVMIYQGRIYKADGDGGFEVFELEAAADE